MSRALAPVFKAWESSPEQTDLGTKVVIDGNSSKNTLPDLDYPSPLTVKNTFIDAQLDRPFSLEGFLLEREVRSCPTSAIEIPFEDRWNELAADKSHIDQQQSRRGDVVAGSSSSRSTSVGSSSRRSSAEESPATFATLSPDSQAEASEDPPAFINSGANTGLPEFDYPSPFFVKSTFIHANIGRPLSLDGFFEERQLQSCPASGICLPSEFEEEEVRELEAGVPFEAGAASIVPVPFAPAYLKCSSSTGKSAIPPPPPAPPVLTALPQDISKQSPPPPPARWSDVEALPADLSTSPPPQVLLLSEAVLRPALGSRDLPTVGSETHHLGTCNPCAHAHGSKGCRNGVQCGFCHLCPKGELKRRQQAKRWAKRKAIDAAESAAPDAVV